MSQNVHSLGIPAPTLQPTHVVAGEDEPIPRSVPALGSKAQVLLQWVVCPNPALLTQEPPLLQVLSHGGFLAFPFLTTQPPPQTSFLHTSVRYVGGLSSGI